MKRKRRHKKLTRAIERKIVPVNPGDRDWTRNRFILWFGAHGSTYLMVWANSLDTALDEAVDWIADHAPGLLCDEQVEEEYRRLVAEGMSDERAQQEAEVDTTIAGNEGHHLHSWEWGIVKEGATRADVLTIAGRRSERRAHGVDPLARKAGRRRRFEP